MQREIVSDVRSYYVNQMLVHYSDINDDIINIWKAFPSECGGRIPLLFPPSKDGCLLFISFNPSFPKELQIKQWTHPYDISSLEAIDKDKVIEQEMETHNFLRYFKPLKDIARQLHLPFSHLDIFMIRDTSQEHTKKIVLGIDNQFTPFGQRQYNLFIRALQRSTPKVIVVVNALASHIIKTHLKLNYDNRDGCYYALDTNIKAPFLLGSTLSGQRALDIYNRERLVWHIQTILRNS